MSRQLAKKKKTKLFQERDQDLKYNLWNSIESFNKIDQVKLSKNKSFLARSERKTRRRPFSTSIGLADQQKTITARRYFRGSTTKDKKLTE